MAIEYKVVAIRKPGDEFTAPKYYARPAPAQRVDIERLADEISYSTTLTDVEVEGVIKALIRQMQVHMQNGRIVQLGKFGSFRVTLNSEGQETAEAFTARHIRNVNIRFAPGTTLKNAVAISNPNLSFRRSTVVDASELPEEPDAQP